jgi:hypothetical protein
MILLVQGWGRGACPAREGDQGQTGNKVRQNGVLLGTMKIIIFLIIKLYNYIISVTIKNKLNLE